MVEEMAEPDISSKDVDSELSKAIEDIEYRLSGQMAL
jgi:hypothetical protein